MAIFPKGTGGFLDPSQIIDELGIVQEGMSVADFGCGHGYFTLPLAKRVKDEGKVFALDVLKEALQAVESKAKMEGMDNVKTIRCNLEKFGGSKLKDESCDIVWLVNLLFQTEDDEIVIKEAKRVLKKDGKLVFIDWRPGVSLGPKAKRVNPEEIKELIEKQNFTFKRNFPTDNYHFGMIFKK